VRVTECWDITTAVIEIDYPPDERPGAILILVRPVQRPIGILLVS